MVSQFVECCIQPILTLCMSGTRLMAAQGTACLTSIASVCGHIGYPRAVPRLCDEILGPKVHKNRKRASVIALTCALRVWDPSSFQKFLDQLTKAVREAATNRDPTVREEGWKLYVLHHHSKHKYPQSLSLSLCFPPKYPADQLILFLGY